jgi:hypothetical protein
MTKKDGFVAGRQISHFSTPTAIMVRSSAEKKDVQQA